LKGRSGFEVAKTWWIEIDCEKEKAKMPIIYPAFRDVIGILFQIDGSYLS